MSRTPSKSPKTRRTYTRRSPRTKLHNALDELRDLIDRHCGAPAAMAQPTKTILQQQKENLPVAQPITNASDPFTNLFGPTENATLQPLVNTRTQVQPLVPSETAADKVTCSGGLKEYNDFVTKFQQEYFQKTGNQIGRRAAQKIIKDTDAWKAECIRTGKAIVPGTARKGKEGKPVDLNVAKQILGNSSAMVQEAMTPKPERNVYMNNLFGPAKTKRTYTKKAKTTKPANNVNPFANTANQKPKTKRTYTKKVKVQAPGNVKPITPGRNVANPFNNYVESVTTTKVNNFDPFANTTANQKPKPNTKQNNFNLFGFNKPQNTVGRINALQNKNNSTTTSSNTYEYEGEPMANGTRIIKIGEDKYYLEPQDKGLYEIDGDDYGELVAYFDPDAPGFMSNSPK
jgi:hypothetical protein